MPAVMSFLGPIWHSQFPGRFVQGFVPSRLPMFINLANAATQIISFATTGIYASFQMVVLASLVVGLSGGCPSCVFPLGGAGTFV